MNHVHAPGTAALLPTTGLAAAPPEEQKLRPADLGELSLDELLNLSLTSVSRRAEPIPQAAAAISSRRQFLYQ